jgi:predicted PurR-regulated permease PerM
MPREMPKAVPMTAGERQQPGWMATSPLAAIIVIAAVLYVARDVFLPLALAMLVAFALSPLVTRLRRMGLPSTASVVVAVLLAFRSLGCSRWLS